MELQLILTLKLISKFYTIDSRTQNGVSPRAAIISVILFWETKEGDGLRELKPAVPLLLVATTLLIEFKNKLFAHFIQLLH